MYTTYVNTVDVLSDRMFHITFPREYLRLMESLHVFREIEWSVLSVHHSKHINEKSARKGDELQFEINDHNQRKFDGIHGIEQIENLIARF